MPAKEKSVSPVYEPDMSRREKHRGDAAEAQLVEDDDGHLVGRCSNEIDTNVAQRLLDDGVRWSPATNRSPWPMFVFNTYKGVPYRAHQRGKTPYYHGFPDVKARIPRSVRDELRRRAAAEGAEDAFDAWMRHTEVYE